VRLDEEKPHFVVVDPLIAGYLLEKLIVFRLLRLTMLIIQVSLFKSH
jgi:hypothetical protein